MVRFWCLTLCVLALWADLTSALTLPELSELRLAAEEAREWVVKCRRELHTIPELGFEEQKTSEAIRRYLDELSIPYRFPVAKTGIVATIGSGQPVFALRTDIDALPIEEEFDESQVPFKSTHPGRMHACGHDAHAAMLLGAAKLLKAREGKLLGTVVLLFQPAEEGRGGAQRVIQEGGLEGVQAMAGLHVWPSLPSGVIATRPGVIMAAADMFSFRVVGRGGHGAIPHLTADPVVAAAAVVLALQPLVSRETSPTDGAVVTVARFNTGPGAPNVIPDSVQLSGTIRSLSLAGANHLHRRLVEVAELVSAAHGCTATDFTWLPAGVVPFPHLPPLQIPDPPTINDATMATLVADVAKGLSAVAAAEEGGDSAVRFVLLDEPSMAAEDFSFYGHHFPAVFSWLGIGNSTLGTTMGLHTSTFQMDESQLPLGVALHVATALEYMAQHGGGITPDHGHEEL